jgi:hypothetical protein
MTCLDVLVTVNCQVTIETITRALGKTNPESRVNVLEQLNAEQLM